MYHPTYFTFPLQSGQTVVHDPAWIRTPRRINLLAVEHRWDGSMEERSDFSTLRPFFPSPPRGGHLPLVNGSQYTQYPHISQHRSCQNHTVPGMKNRYSLKTLREALKFRALPEKTSRKLLRVERDHAGPSVGSVQMTKITRVLLRAPEYTVACTPHTKSNFISSLPFSESSIGLCSFTRTRSPHPAPSCGLSARKQ